MEMMKSMSNMFGVFMESIKRNEETNKLLMETLISLKKEPAVSSASKDTSVIPVVKKRTRAEASAIDKAAERRLIESDGADFLQQLNALSFLYEQGVSIFKHAFVATNIVDHFIEYHEQGNYGFTVLRYRCDHISSNYREHTHMIYKYNKKEEKQFVTRQSHFVRWCRNHKGIAPNKKNNSILINNIVHLFNSILYIQTKKTGKCHDGDAEHKNHTYTDIVFENDAEKESFKRWQLSEQFPDFMDLQAQYWNERNNIKRSRISSPLSAGTNRASTSRPLYLTHNDDELEAMGYFDQ